MKGIVFTELLEMVGDRFSADMVDDIIDDCDLASKGAYTSVGTYPHEEMVALVSALSRRSGIAPAMLLRVFGEHLFGRFAKGYPGFFAASRGAFQFLSEVEDVIHVEVRKLYPDAELPHFETEAQSDDRLVLIYESSRHFEDLADGLIHGCIKYFGESISVARETIHLHGHRRERFVLTRNTS